VTAGVYIGIADLQNEDVQSAVVKVLIATFLLGLASPGHAFRWALCVGACIPLVQFIAQARAVATAYPLSPATSLIVLVPALIGAYSGAFARGMMTQAPQT
jgi:hypothetical protein